ncbi:DoxX family protein [Solicola gregarius]|uniref:DoxX family protein n=1 Tax=Solicola gregarius TaxID=2908642 RepID=A0AA46YKE3_9ACTN|nr:hypothetical protein [Solicola gregarius]UYM04469.1 hypothetical protein L0C25_18305 [Solicola gregarius]
MDRDVKVLALLLAGMGALHFARPEPFERIVPAPLPYKRELVYASGLAELACAATLANPRTRRLGGWATAALMVGVFPANLQMCASVVRSEKAPLWYKAGTIARLPLQVPLVKTAMKAARTAR